MLGMASVAGLGGGIVFVPLMMAFYHFKPSRVVILSLAVVFESGLIRTFGFSFWAKHPEKDATEIDFNTIQVAYPLFLVGSYLGVLTSMILPDILLCAFLTVILVYLCGQSYFKGRDMWQKEAKALLEIETIPFSEQKELVSLNRDDSVSIHMFREIDRDPKEEEELYTIIDREKKSTHQWQPILESLGLTLLTIVVNFIRGTKSFPSAFGINQCSAAGWSVFFIFIVICVLMSIKNIRKIQHEQALKKKYSKGLSKSDIILEGWTTAKLISGGLFGSWIGVTFGLGGGIIFNPI